MYPSESKSAFAEAIGDATQLNGEQGTLPS